MWRCTGDVKDTGGFQITIQTTRIILFQLPDGTLYNCN